MRAYKRLTAAMAIPISLVLSGCSGPPPVSYVQAAGQQHEKGYPDENAYRSSVDFARLEHELPLSPEDLKEITFRNLQAANQEQVDQIYGRLTAGPIPDGLYKGEFFLPRGESGRRRISEIIGQDFKGVIVNLKLAKLERLGDAIWRGKVFYRDQRISRSRVNEFDPLKEILGEGVGDIAKTTLKGQEMGLAFPAKMYCGQSLLDGRRESIILDYAFSDDIEGYRQRPDALAGRDGFMVREEIRMVRPGLYLGRAYMGRMFVANFVLLSADKPEAGQIQEDCSIGSQRMAADRHGS